MRTHIKAEAERLRRLSAQHRLAELLALCEEVPYRDRALATDRDNLKDDEQTRPTAGMVHRPRTRQSPIPRAVATKLATLAKLPTRCRFQQ